MTTDQELFDGNIRRSEITLTVDDDVIHTTDWADLQVSVDACLRWAYRKWKHWKSAKCTVIFKSEAELEDGKIKFFIGEAEIRKGISATYLGMKITSCCIRNSMNHKRSNTSI